MQEVVCFNCGRIVDISPDAELCSVCGENLRELIHPAYISKYFYDRAAEMAAGDELLQALREIDRGLTYHDSSELRLLGAILSQRIGDFAQMRHHVAAVPIHDVLRPEAEWLLRSHQSRQRAQRAGVKSPSEKSPSLAELDPLPPLALVAQNGALSPRPLPQHDEQETAAAEKRVLAYMGLGVVALITAGAVLVMSSFFPSSLSRVPFLSNLIPTGSVTESQNPGPAETVRQSDGTSEAEGLVDTENDGRTNPVLQPTPTLNGQVPDDVVMVTLEPLAGNTPNELFIPLVPIEVNPYFTEINRPDLAALDVSATSQDGTILLQGIVPSFQARQDLLVLMAQAPGVKRVSGADLLIRLPPTYTVQAGDTLWAISARFYGESRVDALLAANQGVLTSADALRVGMELTIPTLE